MHPDVFRGQWQRLKGDIKMRWGRLTNDDLDSIGGAIDKLERRLQERYGWGEEEAVRELDAWARERGVWA